MKVDDVAKTRTRLNYCIFFTHFIFTKYLIYEWVESIFILRSLKLLKNRNTFIILCTFILVQIKNIEGSL